MKYIYTLLLLTMSMVTYSCSGGAPSGIITSSLEVKTGSDDAFRTLASVQTKAEKSSEKAFGVTIDHASYVYNMTLTPKEDCYFMKNQGSERSYTQRAPLCLSDSMIKQATEDMTKLDPTKREQLAKMLRAQKILGFANNLDREHPLKSGTEITVSNVALNCDYDRSASSPRWVCR